MTRNPLPPPSSNHDSVTDDDLDDGLDDDRFNEAVDAIQRSDREGLDDIDPAMHATIAQLFAWANLSGYTDEPPTPSIGKNGMDAITEIPSRSFRPLKREDKMQQATFPATPGTFRTSSSGSASGSASGRHRPHPVVALFSTIAALLLIGLAAYGARLLFSDQDGPELPAPSEVAFGGGGDTPTMEPSNSSVVGNPGLDANGVDPVTSDECTVQPASRQRILSVLQSPPGNAGDIFNAQTMSSDPNTSSFDSIPVADLDQTFREWQACVKFGFTWRYMAIQTDYMTRADIYGWQTFDRAPIPAAYSDTTLNDLLDMRVRSDNERHQAWAELYNQNPESLPETVLVIDTSAEPVFSVSEDGTFIANLPVTKVNQANGDQFPRNGSVTFQLVDGHWLIADVDPWLEF